MCFFFSSLLPLALVEEEEEAKSANTLRKSLFETFHHLYNFKVAFQEKKGGKPKKKTPMKIKESNKNFRKRGEEKESIKMVNAVAFCFQTGGMLEREPQSTYFPSYTSRFSLSLSLSLSNKGKNGRVSIKRKKPRALFIC